MMTWSWFHDDLTGRPSSLSTTEWNLWHICLGNDLSTASCLNSKQVSHRMFLANKLAFVSTKYMCTWLNLRGNQHVHWLLVAKLAGEAYGQCKRATLNFCLFFCPTQCPLSLHEGWPLFLHHQDADHAQQGPENVMDDWPLEEEKDCAYRWAVILRIITLWNSMKMNNTVDDGRCKMTHT